MSGISVSTSGNFNKTFKLLENMKDFKRNKLIAILNKYGERGVQSLREHTPMDSGETANSWSYEIVEEEGKATLVFKNDAQNDGIPIAILIQYGHGTGTGGYVPPNDFINPAMSPIFKKIVDDAWKEVRAL